MAHEAVIGLEVHAQLDTATKAFCACATSFGEAPNTNVCPTCLGLPGALPVLGARVVELAALTGLALGCSLRPRSRFARKNYFYPDLPKGYQISQYDDPFAYDGALELESSGKTIRIERVHVEEDAGKSVHGTRGSAVDLNRSGVPLVEIVSQPDLRSAKEASEYLRTVREILMAAGVCDGDLEQGNFRCDANVSIRRVGETTLGTRVELKNINSFRFVEKALAYEIERQTMVVESGGAVARETRGWDEEKGASFPMRGKEDSADYRYFPDPDLPPLVIPDALVTELRARLPELPREKRRRYRELASDAVAQALTQHPQVSAFFEAALALGLAPAARIANFVASEVLRDATYDGLRATFPVSAAQLAELCGLVEGGTISGKQAKDVYAAMRGKDDAPAAVVASLGMAQM
ncbi:MAG: Asp-tRNA(Asn)/Glu-tRNA(Gln) amidotransferase subunit GatB, partial [Polyangiaceae bacterium]|nr:Asp-tRNA(Asn)/Glu-tRNA(Gln) amidotransferase subunit GatB [Polyangiaceae bacterium]